MEGSAPLPNRKSHLLTLLSRACHEVQQAPTHWLATSVGWWGQSCWQAAPATLIPGRQLCGCLWAVEGAWPWQGLWPAALQTVGALSRAGIRTACALQRLLLCQEKLLLNSQFDRLA